MTTIIQAEPLLWFLTKKKNNDLGRNLVTFFFFKIINFLII